LHYFRAKAYAALDDIEHAKADIRDGISLADMEYDTAYGEQVKYKLIRLRE
jgi:hypothetical protein